MQFLALLFQLPPRFTRLELPAFSSHTPASYVFDTDTIRCDRKKAFNLKSSVEPQLRCFRGVTMPPARLRVQGRILTC